MSAKSSVTAVPNNEPLGYPELKYASCANTHWIINGDTIARKEFNQIFIENELSYRLLPLRITKHSIPSIICVLKNPKFF